MLDLLGGKALNGGFKYTTIGVQVLSGILVNATGKSVLDFATENLFSPLDIDPPENLRIYNKEEHFSFIKDKYVNGWVADPKGVHISWWGLSLITKDMANTGCLYLNGAWHLDNSQG